MTYEEFVKKLTKLDEMLDTAASKSDWRSYDAIMSTKYGLQQTHDNYYRRYLNEVHNN